MSVERIPITDRESWLELRRQDVTASVMGALFRAHPFQTIAGLAAEKQGLDLPGPDPESAVIRRGHVLEPVVAEQVIIEHPEWNLIKNNDYFRDPDARIGCTPDYFLEGDLLGRGILQCKTVGSLQFKKHWNSEDELRPPLWIILQTLTEMMLTDTHFGAIGVLSIGDFEFDTYVVEVPRHKPTEHKIRVAVHAFWDALKAGQVPAIDYERDAEIIKLMYPAAVEGKVVDLRGDNRIIDLLETRELQSGLEKEAKTRKTEAETEIREKLGDAEFAIVNGWKVTLKNQTRAEHLVKASTFRVLRSERASTL